ncbi:MAG: type I DNA topoisomerase [Acidimicrobiales bacterium]|nr:type I DNA topoisomerase [Acidimicrobiales bacterium]
MPNALVIVESPAKAKTIERFLGDDYVVEASVGHIRDLIQPKDVKEDRRYDQAVHAENKTLKNFGILSIRESKEEPWVPWYVKSPSSQKTIAQLRKALKKADALYLATDEDREGEAIAWHLVEVLKPDVPVFRMVFHEITEKAILEALENTREIDMDQVAAQETRRMLDRIIGYDLSGLARQVIGGGATGGRVQSPTLRKIVERERDRIRFVSATYCSATAELISSKQEQFSAKLIEIDGQRIASGKNDFNENGELKKTANLGLVLDEGTAMNLQESLKNKALTVESIETSAYRRQPKAPFTTSTFQQEVINKLGGSSGAAMAIAQSLYQNGYITYHRTDSPGLSDQAIAASRSSIENVCGLDYLPDQPRTYTTKSDSAQEAHEAIRPAGEIFRNPEELKNELNKDQIAVYELIWKRTIASQMTDQVGETVRMSLIGKIDGEKPQNVKFNASGRTITHSGFRQIYDETPDNSDEQEAELESILPDISEGEQVNINEIEINNHVTKSPARFTEASLVKWMEEAGIGRPSTFAATIGKIRKRNYVYKEGRSLIPTIKAFVATNFLENEFRDEVEYQYTANLNEKLDGIADGTTNQIQFLNEWYFKEGAWETKIDDIQGQVKVDLPRIRQESAHSVGLDKETNQTIYARFANQKPYVQNGMWDGETASIPETLPPDQLSVAKAKEFLTLAAEPDTILGWADNKQASELFQDDLIEAETVLGFVDGKGIPVFLRKGSFGPYVSLGDFPKWPRQTSKEGRLMKQPHHLKIIKVACAYLKVAENNKENAAIQTILNEPKRGVGKKSIETLEGISDNEKISLYKALEQQTFLAEKPSKAVKKLLRNLKKWNSDNIEEPTGFRLRELLINTGYWKEVSRMEKAEEKIKLLENLLANMNEFQTVAEVLDVLDERTELKNAPKPKTASLLDKMEPDTISLEDAINLLNLPRVIPITEPITVTLNPAPKKGDTSFNLMKGGAISVHNGPFGPYLKADCEDGSNQTRSITEDEIFTANLEDCIKHLGTPKKFARKQSKKIILKDPDGKVSLDNVSGKPIEIKTGKFGPYVTDGVTNASLQLGDSIEQMTGERAKELLAERRAQQNTN